MSTNGKGTDDIFADLAKQIAATSDLTVAKARKDICAFVEFVLRDNSGNPIILKPFHREMLEAMVDDRLVMIEAFRGSGKSTLSCVAYPLWCLMKNRNVRIMIVTESDILAKNWLREIERYMGGDSYIKLAGPMIPGKGQGLTWTATEKIITGRSEDAQGASVLAVGAHGQIRGRRVDRIIADDLVSENNSHTIYQREVLSNWFHGALMPTLDIPMEDNIERAPSLDTLGGQIIYLDTPLYDNDLSFELRKKWAKRAA